jgi:hypothetical protein
MQIELNPKYFVPVVKAPVSKLSTIDILRSFTFYTCDKCPNGPMMEYVGDVYVCEECYREIHPNAIMYGDPDFYINWCEIKNFILKHRSPKKVIKMFIVKILEQTYWEPQIDQLLKELQTNNTFMGR